MLDEAKLLASDIMTRDVTVVHPETTLLAAVKLMASRGISGLPVVDEHGTLVGMMSEADLLRWHEGFSEREVRWLHLAGRRVRAGA
jgi:CBS domain-containing protein